MFLEGMQVYRAYWKNDPEFDTSNTDRACPHLPCPEMDAAMIMQMCRYAIESNFGWPRPPALRPEFDVHAHLGTLLAAADGDDDGRVLLGLKDNGHGGGQWELEYDRGRIVAARPGLTPRSTATFYLNSTTFERLARDETSVGQAISTGRVVIEGNGVPPDELARALHLVARGHASSGAIEGAPTGPPES
jgi:hypothetical protein